MTLISASAYSLATIGWSLFISRSAKFHLSLNHPLIDCKCVRFIHQINPAGVGSLMMKINEKNLCMFATTPPVDLEGWLNKRGEINKSWQRRWFVLKGNLLFYFERKGDREPLGMVILEGCTVGNCVM